MRTFLLFTEKFVTCNFTFVNIVVLLFILQETVSLVLYAMNVSCFFTFIFLLLMQTVQSDLVEGVIGDNVLLPCVIEQNPQDVYWRYRDNTVVCDISNGKADFDKQAPAYKDRVKIFPSEIEKGNFSIMLSNVNKSDAGPYSCHAPNIKTLNVELKVKERQTTTVKVSTVSPNGGSRRRADGLLAFLLGCALIYSLIF